MKLLIPDNLYELAQLFASHAPLYVVGGAVRNSLLGIIVNDYDIASSLTVEEVESLLQNTAFKIIASFKRTGTVVIGCGNDKYEYTTFRQDSYPLNSGNHTPQECVFTSDINVDARRRDFTCNALYYDILKEEVIDLVGGVQDIKNKVLRTVREPEQTLSEDALRIMRLVRFSVQLAFKIDNDTFKAGKVFSQGLKDISKERIHDELMLIFEGVFKYNSIQQGVKPSDGIRLLCDIGAMEHIIPEILEMQGVMQNKKYHIYDVFNHTLATIDNLPPRLMMAGLLHDIAKPVLQKEYGKMYGHEIIGEDIARQIMTRLKFSNVDIERTARLVKMHMFNVDNKTRESKCRVFIAQNFDLLDDFIALRRADGLATNPNNYDDSSAVRILALKEEMVYNNLPFTIKDLPINGNDLMKIGYQGKEIKEILNSTLLRILHNGKKESKQEILSKLRR